MGTKQSRAVSVVSMLVVAIGLLVTAPAAAAPASTPQPQRGEPNLANAEIPESCGHPATTLDGYEKDFGQNGFAKLLVNKARTGRLGAERLKTTVVPLLCTAGGVSWPNLVLLYDATSRLVGAIDLAGERHAQEHLDVKRIRIRNHRAHLTLTGYDGCCFTTTIRTAKVWRSTSSFSWQSSGVLTIDFAHGRGDTTYGGPGIVESATDAAIWLNPAPKKFKRFIARRWKRLLNGCNAAVYVDRYSHKGFAIGAETACGGARTVWAQRDGRWRLVLGYQDGPYCYGLTKLQRRALKVLGQSCYDRHFKRHKLGNWPRSGM